MNKPHPSKVAPSPSWTLEKGISYSLLSRFINCRERFRLYAVEGMREEFSALDSMNWGTYFHELIELHSKYPNSTPAGIIRRAKKKVSGLPKKQADAVFHKYVEHYAECNYNYVGQEIEFRVPYVLPNGKKINLVGKTDEILLQPDKTLWIQENKTKEKINEFKIECGLIDDLQTMMYSTCVQILMKKPVTGVVYNVVRKPSSKPKTLPKTKTRPARKETTPEYISRLNEEIDKNPNHYFKRWEIPFPPGHLEAWQKRSFDPLLMQLYRWWESVKHDPFSPWTTPSGEPNLLHWRKPFGVYDNMTTGVGDFFDYLNRGLSVGVSVGNEPFPELETIS